MAAASGLVAPSGGRLLPLLLVVALLLCHGAFGVLHLVHPSCDQCDPSRASSVEHHLAAEHDEASGDAVGDPGDGSTHGLGNSGYFAVVVALLGSAAVLGMLLGVARGLAVVAFSRSIRPLRPPLADLLPRGPTLPLLQVFRL